MAGPDGDQGPAAEETSKLAPSTRVYQFHEYRQRAKELKRSRGEISCFECRRLKIRCDKKVPCTSCTKRRCEDICPNGPSMKAPTEIDILKVELGVAKERIRQLEEALQKAHAKFSNVAHPLLAKDEVRREATRNNALETTGLSSDSEADIVESFGTLTISEGGVSRFLGPSAASETLIAADFPSLNPDNEHEAPALPRQVLQASRLWPFTPAYLTTADHQSLIEANLPSYMRASALCEAFLENLAWLHTPILRSQLMEELLPTIYKKRASTPQAEKPIEIHDLALVLAVFACGAAGDLTQKPDNEEGRAYYTLARAAMGLGASRNSVAAIQALILLSLYLRFSWSCDDMEESWKMLSIALGMAKSMGLHRDPGRWKLDIMVQERRRSVFYVLYLLDNYYALSAGRPPTFTLRSVDVKYPQETLGDLISDGTKNLNFKFWKYELLRRCLAPVTERYCGDVKPIKYQEVLDLERRIVEYKAEESEKGERAYPGEQFTDVLLPFKQRFLQLNCDTLRIQIHRNFFARAIIDYPENPLKSPFAGSFSIVFGLASGLLKEFHNYSESSLPLLLRMWPYWLHMLIAGVVVGSVAARCATSNVAPSAFAALEMAILAFKKAIQHPVVANGLRILMRLRDKASTAMFALPQSPKTENEDDELDVLRGASRLVSQKPAPPHSKSGASSTSSGSPAFQTPSPQPANAYISNFVPDSMPIPPLNSAQPQLVTQMEAPSFDWTSMDIDAILSSHQVPDWITSTVVDSVVEDSSFASLEPEIFLAPVPDLPKTDNAGGHSGLIIDQWNDRWSTGGQDDWPF